VSIDDLVGAKRAHEIQLRRAADTRHVRAERLRQLDGECADSATGAGDQDSLPAFNVRLVAQAEKCGAARGRDRCSLLEAEVRRLRGEPLRLGPRVLGE
jgi:hypothetical protein